LCSREPGSHRIRSYRHKFLKAKPDATRKLAHAKGIVRGLLALAQCRGGLGDRIVKLKLNRAAVRRRSPIEKEVYYLPDAPNSELGARGLMVTRIRVDGSEKDTGVFNVFSISDDASLRVAGLGRFGNGP
jgi:hypothetical protein